MPRSRGGSGGRTGGGRRPSVTPQRSSAPPTQTQSRSSSTAAQPPAGAQQAPGQQQQGRQPGLFGQMASTAAGVAVGSSIGHAIGGFFGGGSAPQEQQQDGNFTAQHQDNTTGQTNSWAGTQTCDADARGFTKCMDENQGNMQICSWYLQQLKACQAAASQF